MVPLGKLALVSVALVLLAAPTAQPESAGRKHWWPFARGRLGKYGVTDEVGPSNLSASLAWNWEHPDMAIVTGCLLDDRKNIYVASVSGIHKLNPDGRILWHHSTLSPFQADPTALGGQFYNNHVGSLVDGALYGAGIGGPVFKLDAETGETIWRVQVGQEAEMDCPYVQVYRGVVTFSHGKDFDPLLPMAGNRAITALNASDGGVLWEYTSQTVLWNFHPMFPGDDTFITMDIHGGLFRRGLFNGSVVWYTPPPLGSESSYSDGGQILGPDSNVYSCANFGHGYGQVNSLGVLRKHDVTSGQLLWERQLPHPCVSWPAASAEQVVVPLGALPKPTPHTFDVGWLPQSIKLAVHALSNYLGPRANLLWNNPPAQLAVMAFEPETGLPKWTYDSIAPWTRICSMGDEDYMLDRLLRWPARPVCGPASWSTPTIGGDGTVYAGAMNGYLYAVRDRNADGIVEDGKEVSRLWMGSSPLHGGPIFAPGLMVFPSCSGIWVFRW